MKQSTNIRLAILAALALTGCDSGWKGPFKEAGPLPLSNSNTPISRLIKTNASFEVTLKEVLWDEGSGPVPVAQRVKPLLDAVPSEIKDQLHLTKPVPRQHGNGTFDQPLFSAWVRWFP